MPEQKSNKTFFAGLDSLRFCAFLLVFFFHSTPAFKIGYTGVLFFFVISAFLLTNLALEEISNSGRFNPYHFFMRRALRIYPLYYLIVLFAFLLLPILSNIASIPVTLPANKWYYLVFLSNYDYSDHIFFLKFLWSIAVEEQFYIGFALIAFTFKRSFWAVWGVLLMLYIIIMLLNISGKIELGYYNTLTYLPCFLTGMAIAKIRFSFPQTTQRLIFLLPLIAAILYFSSFYIAMLNEFLNCTAALLFGGIIALVLYVQQIRGPILSRLLSPTEFLGKLTYGLYVYSGLVFTFNIVVLKLKEPFIKQITEFILILLIAYISYRFFEKPILQYKKKWN